MTYEINTIALSNLVFHTNPDDVERHKLPYVITKNRFGFTGPVNEAEMISALEKQILDIKIKLAEKTLRNMKL